MNIKKIIREELMYEIGIGDMLHDPMYRTPKPTPEP